MPTSSTADRLLDAQVAFFLGQLDDDALSATLTQLVDDVLDVAGRVTLAEVADTDAIGDIARRVVAAIAASEETPELAAAMSDAIYDLPAADDHVLADIVAREPIEALVATVLGLRRAQDRAMERVAQSPLAGAVAAKFITTIIGDFVQQNRQRAEKLPGMSSLLSLGQNAASRMPGMAMLGDAAGKGAQLAVKRTNGALRDVMRDAPLQDAAMEIWDLQAAEVVGDLREYLTRHELRDLVLLGHDLLVSAHDSALVGAVIDTVTAVVVDRFGDRDLATLLADLGVGRDELIADAAALLTPIITRLRDDGTLADLLRARLRPFYDSAEVAAILSPPRKRPAPKPS